MPGSPGRPASPYHSVPSGHFPSPLLTVLSMNPKHYYHTPIKPISTRASCPVCHQAVYSRSGIHPQCAVIQYDPPKPRSKKPHAEGLAETAIEAPDQPVPELVVELPIIKAPAVADRSSRPAGVNTGRAVPRGLGSVKQSSSRFNR